MKKQTVLNLVVEFPRVELLSNNKLLIAYHAVIDPGDGCKICALKGTDFCHHLNCDNVVYLPVLAKPCL